MNKALLKLKDIKAAVERRRLATQISLAKEINLIIGSSEINYPHWISSNKHNLNITNIDDFYGVLGKRKIDKLLAEHVLEHIDNKDLSQALNNIYSCLTTSGNFRIAVPDGYHRDADYIEQVKPGGTGNGSDDHKHLFTYETLGKLLIGVGFRVKLVEYWDEHGQFHTVYSNDDQLGCIRRSFINDKRNSDGKPHYTSLIIDATKI